MAVTPPDSGGCDVTSGKVFSIGELFTRIKLNLLGTPTVRVSEGAIGERELNATAVRQLVPSVIRNVLVNGNFDVWQRGGYTNSSGLPEYLAESADLEYTADRWKAADPSGGVSTRRVYRGDFDLGQTVVPNEPTYYLRWDQLAGGTAPTLSQPVEDVRTLAGKSVTVSWWMKSNTSGSITCQLEQFFGGSPGTTRVITATSGGTATLTGGASWRLFTAKFTVPNLVGYTIGGDRAALSVVFIMPSAATFITDFSQVQMEQSTEATNFETHSYQYEFERCLRYFEFHGGVMSINPVETVAIPIQLDAMTTLAADLMTNYVPGYHFKIIAVDFITTKLGAGAGATQTLNLEIGTTNVTGGEVNITLASTDTLGEITAGAAITAGNVGTNADTLSIEVVATGTVFTAGEGVLIIKIEKRAVETVHRPLFYFSVRKYRAPTLTLFSSNPGTGATFASGATVAEDGYSQNTANSVMAAFVMRVDAEI